MTRDIAAVALGLAVAALALSEALGLPIGTLRSPGQGFFPLWLGVLLLALSLVLLPQTLRARRGPAAGRQPHRTGGRSRGRARRLHRGPGSDRLSDRHLLPRALHGEDHAPAALAARARNLAARRRRLVSALRRVAEGAAAAGLMEILSLLGSGFAIALTPENLFYCFVGSLVGTAIGVLPGLGLLAPPLASFALKFGAPENAALLILGLLMVGYLGGASMTKGLMMAAVGLLLGSVGLDPIQGTPRFTYGVFKLSEGFDFVLVAMGLFGIGEVLANVEQKEEPEVITTKIGGLLATREEWKAAAAPMARGSLLGFIIGVLPGGGAIISSFVSYALEKRFSRHPERFGKGAIEGVAAPEAANNGAASSSFIPLLTLGIPGNASIALIFAALLIHGIRPGPLLVAQQPQLFWGLIASMYIGNVMLLVLNLPLIRVWVRLLQVPYGLLAPFIIVFVLVGAYTVNNSAFDVGVAVAFGLVGYVLRKLHFEPAPPGLAGILGPPLEASVRRALIFSRGDGFIFFQRPISAVLITLAVLMLLSPPARRGLGPEILG